MKLLFSAGHFYALILLTILLIINNGLAGKIPEEFKNNECGWRLNSNMQDDGTRPGTSGSRNLVVSMVSNGVFLTGREEHPWLVYLIVTFTNPETNIPKRISGTGVIIGQHWILTAAHNVHNATIQLTAEPSEIQIIIAYDTSSASRTEVATEKVILHDEQTPFSEWCRDDIALLRLVNPLDFTTPQVQPLCLLGQFSEKDKCTQPTATKEELDNQHARVEVAGYGKTDTLPHGDYKNDKRIPPDIAHRGLMRFMCPEQCPSIMIPDVLVLGNTNSGPRKQYFSPSCASTHMCLYNTNANTEAWAEKGDSGSPAVLCPVTGKRSKTQRCASVGMALNSNAKIEGDKRKPVEYARISHYCAWIEQKTENQVRCLQSLEGAAGEATSSTSSTENPSDSSTTHKDTTGKKKEESVLGKLLNDSSSDSDSSGPSKPKQHCGWRSSADESFWGPMLYEKTGSNIDESDSDNTNKSADRPASIFIYNGKWIDKTKRHPWIVMVKIGQKDGILDAATGFIVGPHWVITAASFVKNSVGCETSSAPKFKIITASNWKMASKSEKLAVSEVVCDEEKNSTAGIALLKLKDPLNFTSSPEMQPLCLLETFDERDKCTDHGSTDEALAKHTERAEVVGYGFMKLQPAPENGKEDSRELSHIARRGTMRFMCSEHCHGKAADDTNSTFVEQHLCLWNTDSKTEAWLEPGDSGAPAVWCPVTDHVGNMQRCAAVGVASSSEAELRIEEKESTRRPNMFARLSRYCGWIANKTEGEVSCVPSLEAGANKSAEDLDLDTLLRKKFFPMAAAAYGDAKAVNSCLTGTWKNTELVKHIVVTVGAGWFTSGYKISCFIAVIHDEKAIVVSFRGTEASLQQLFTEVKDGSKMVNVTIGKKEYPELVVMPFADYHAKLEQEYSHVLQKLVFSYKYRSYRVCFTGASLGGALAAISAYGFLKQKPKFYTRTTALVTFGQPRTGNHDFAAFLNKGIDTIYRVVHRKDGVVRMPFEMTYVPMAHVFGFSGTNFTHSGEEVFYDNDMAGADYEMCKRNSGGADSEKCGIIKTYGSLVGDVTGKKEAEDALNKLSKLLSDAISAYSEYKKSAIKHAADGPTMLNLMGLSSILPDVFNDHIYYYGEWMSDYGKKGCKSE